MSCGVSKKVNAAVRRKVSAALADIKKNKPRNAGVKLHEAAELVSNKTNGIWDPKTTMNLGNEAFWVGSRLMTPSMMRSPKWKDRVAVLLANVDRQIKKTALRCDR